jgi:hypothetical protein
VCRAPRGYSGCGNQKMEDEMSEEHTIRIFGCGMEYQEWLEHNCKQCKRYNSNEASREACEIDYEFGSALIGDGKISAEIADRAGYKNDGMGYRFSCAEIETKDGG